MIFLVSPTKKAFTPVFVLFKFTQKPLILGKTSNLRIFLHKLAHILGAAFLFTEVTLNSLNLLEGGHFVTY
jgi:hypothetical protein